MGAAKDCLAAIWKDQDATSQSSAIDFGKQRWATEIDQQGAKIVGRERDCVLYFWEEELRGDSMTKRGLLRSL